jgi:hypothetical protein
MRKRTDYTILALAIPLLIAVGCNLPGCYTQNKPITDGQEPQGYIREFIGIDRDEQGLFYVRYVTNTGERKALDAITVKGFNELLKGNIQDVYNDTQHTCVDNSHHDCDGMCECDGLGCSTATNY